MPYIAPNSTVQLFKNIPFDMSYNDTMYFGNLFDQNDWFDNKKESYLTFNNLSYQRSGRGKIKLESPMINVYDCNYMRFANDSFEAKWFYAFITDIEYVNNITVEISYVIDVVQTWLVGWGEAELSECFIERQHTETDNFGENLIPEPLDLGPMVYDMEGEAKFPQAFVLITTIDLSVPGLIFSIPVVPMDGYRENDPQGDPNTTIWGGAYFTKFENTTADLASLEAVLAGMSALDMKDNVIAMITVASNLWSATGQNPPIITDGFDRPSQLGNYTPRNKKLLSYPFNSLSISTGKGDETIFRYELFNNDNVVGRVRWTYWENAGPLSSIVLTPKGYRGKATDFDASIERQCVQCTWNNDEFLAWLAQNTLGISNTIADDVRPIYGSKSTALMPANPKEGLADYSSMENAGSKMVGVSYGMDSVNAIADVMNHSISEPNILKGHINNTTRFQLSGYRFSCFSKHITNEYAQKIDSFFDMFGYAVRKVAVPNLHARPKYTYVKTIGANVHGSVPASDARVLERILDKGIRFWDKNAVFGSYDKDVNNNSPI